MFRTALLAFVACCLVHPVSAEVGTLLTKVRAGDDVKIDLIDTSLTATGSWPGSLQTWLNRESPGPGTVTVVFTTAHRSVVMNAEGNVIWQFMAKHQPGFPISRAGSHSVPTGSRLPDKAWRSVINPPLLCAVALLFQHPERYAREVSHI